MRGAGLGLGVQRRTRNWFPSSRSSEARGDIAVPMAASNSGARRPHGSRGERVISSDLGVSSGRTSFPLLLYGPHAPEGLIRVKAM